MALFLQIVSGIALLVVLPFLVLGWVFGIISASPRTFGATLFLIGIPLAWLSCVGLWLYWVGGWHAVWVIAGIMLLGPYVRGRYRKPEQDRSRVVPAAPRASPPDSLKD